MYITILTERHGVYGFMGLWVYGFMGFRYIHLSWQQSYGRRDTRYRSMVTALVPLEQINKATRQYLQIWQSFVL
jgi:hypothetical protein